MRLIVEPEDSSELVEKMRHQYKVLALQSAGWVRQLAYDDFWQRQPESATFENACKASGIENLGDNILPESTCAKL